MVLQCHFVSFYRVSSINFLYGKNVYILRIEHFMNIMQAFPAGSGPMDRTTYMFTYVDPQPGCPKLEELLEDYWDLMPNYQVVLRNVVHAHRSRDCTGFIL